jgi:hypothetical protein
LGRLAVVGRYNSAGSIRRCISSLVLGPDMLKSLVVARCGRRWRVRYGCWLLSHIRKTAYVWWRRAFVCNVCLKAKVVGGLRHASFRDGRQSRLTRICHPTLHFTFTLQSQVRGE